MRRNLSSLLRDEYHLFVQPDGTWGILTDSGELVEVYVFTSSGLRRISQDQRFGEGLNLFKEQI